MSPLTLVAMSLAFVVVQLDVTIVNVALQRIGVSFASSVAGLQWVVNAYTIAFASLILSAGALGDRIGAKRVFIVGFALFTAASSLALLMAAWTLQRIGAAILVPCSLALLSHTYRNAGERAKAVGIWAGGAGVALAAGPVIGGALIDSIGWRSISSLSTCQLAPRASGSPTAMQAIPKRRTVRSSHRVKCLR